MARNRFDVDETLQSEFNKYDIIRIAQYLKPYKIEISIVVIIMIIASLASMSGPYLFKVAIDTNIKNGDIKGLFILGGIFLFTVLINAICIKHKIKIMTVVGQDIIFNIRHDIFEHLQKLSFTFYDSRPHGKILVRVVNYVNSISDLLSNGIINLFTDLLSLVVIIGFMFSIDAKLTIIALVGLPVLTAFVFLIKKMHRSAWQNYSNKVSNLTAYVSESINGVKVTQSFAREEENAHIFAEQVELVSKGWLKGVKFEIIVALVVEIISTLTICAIYITGLLWVSGNAVSVGVLVAFTGYISRFWQPIINISKFYNQIVTNVAYLERIFETMDEKPEIVDKPDAWKMPSIEGNVEFKDVDFSYEEGHEILSQVSFKIESGQSVALVGPTGAGKSTIVSLVSRFYDVRSGAVLIDGVDISKVKQKTLRSQMGVMLQDSFIFSGTIMDNIRYGKLDAKDEEVIEAARVVCAHEFIEKLPDGYYTQVHEQGSTLSAGQRQLISFARTLLSNPKILILDEATSSIDTQTEIALQKGLDRLLEGRTSFIIAHRLSTIKKADVIMYISDKKVLESGTHDELIKKAGNYYELYESQYAFVESL